jgi:hypothetical protein
MRKRFTKSVLVGALVVIVSAIVAGPAFGDTQQSGGSSKQQVSSGGDTIPPYVLRTMGKQYMTLDKAKPASIPGYTDFPNALRLHNTLTPTERKQLDAAVASNSSVSSSSDSGFSWSDAGVGIGIGLAIAGGLALLAVFGSRRGKATPVTA